MFTDGEEFVINDCWNQIGVFGDRSCPELKEVIHCYECPVYAAVGDTLLEREAPADYLEKWLNILEETSSGRDISDRNEVVIRTADAISLIIFRLGHELLSLPVKMLQEITYPVVIQPLPHRSNQLFLGLVNIRGETLLCASLSYLLNITNMEDNKLNRMIIAGKDDEKWVFPVDEVYGIFRFYSHELKNPPVVITKSEESYTQGIVHWEGKKVNYLDSDLLFYSLSQKIL